MEVAQARSAINGRRRVVIAVALIAFALGFVVFKGLANATVYFKTADEAVADKAKLGSRQFRIEGTVVDGSVQELGRNVGFVIRGRDASVAVRHAGDPPELFKAGIPVVLEGHFVGNVFQSDRIMVKHSSQYRAKNPSRVKAYSQ